MDNSGFDNLQFIDRQHTTDSYPPSTATVTPDSHGSDSNSHGLRFSVAQNHPAITTQSNGMHQQAYPLMDQSGQSRRSSIVYDSVTGDPVGYGFGPSPNQSTTNNNASPSIMFPAGNPQLQQSQQQPGGFYDGAERFNLDTGYDSAPFTTSLDPMSAFNSYVAPDNFQNAPMNMQLAYGVSTAPTVPPQPMNMVFPGSTYAPMLQHQLHGPNTSGSMNQENWPNMSNFDLSLSGQNLQSIPLPGSPAPQNRLAMQIKNKNDSNVASSYVPSEAQPRRISKQTSVNNTPFIPAEIAASKKPKPGGGKVASQYLNAYSSSGFDMFGILARIASRPNPEIDIGAVDMSCAFILCDVTSHDDPIVYVSDAFERLTGYTKHEILGRNCRFLQAPDGKVDPGIKRKFVDDQTVYRLKEKIRARTEVQVSMINYKKGGQSFMNLLTMIPIQWGSSEYRFYVGFQVDLVEQPQAVTKRNADGSYTINYQRDQLPRYVLHAPDSRKTQASLFKSISHSEVSTLLKSLGAGTKDISSRYLDRMLLENSDDVIHVLSLKGLFLYLSQSSSRLLEYDPSELVGKSISSVCHPSDIAPVTRELKQTTVGSPVSVVYRIQRKNNGYMWFESHGSLHVEPGKGRKCLILVGRERPVYTLDKSSVLEVGGIGENDLWTKVSISGMFLFVSSNSRALLDRTPSEMIGCGIQEFMRSESRGELGKALEVARTGQQASFKHEIRHKRGHVLQARTTLFPGDAIPGSKPSYLVAQTRLIKSSRASYLAQRNPDPSATGFVTSTSSETDPQTNVSLQTKPAQIIHPAPTEAGSHGLPLGSQDQALLSDTNIFEELKSVRSSSWQFELRQLERHNRLLAEELQGLITRRKKRKRKKGTGPLEKACANCGTRNTPEWRRGPSGNRDLCNSCGLRWAKQNGRVSPRKSDQNDKHSSASSASAKASPSSISDDRPNEKLDSELSGRTSNETGDT